MKLCDII